MDYHIQQLTIYTAGYAEVYKSKELAESLQLALAINVNDDVLPLGCVTGYQVIRVIRIFAKTYPFE